MKKTFHSRITALLLALLLVGQCVPVTQVYAADGTVQVSTAADLPTEIPAGSTYELTADIVLEPNQTVNSIAGTLDGKGHTITLNGKPLAQTVSGTVQNLKTDGKANLADGEGVIAVTSHGGTIQNCGSTVEAAVINSMFGGVGGLVGRGTGTKIYNSYFAGTAMDTDFYISQNNGVLHSSEDPNAPSLVKSCYYTRGNSAVYRGDAWNMDDPSNGMKSLDEMKSPDFVNLLNAQNIGAGYVWEAVNGDFPRLVPGGSSIETANKQALEAAIKDAESKVEANYTEDSWAAMQTALQSAKALRDQIDAAQVDVDAAAKALNEAIAALQERVWDHAPVALPQDVVTISSPAELAKISGQDAAYQLTQDLVITENFHSVDLSGIFDGGGHTITFRTETVQELFRTITATGVVQNLKIKVESNFPNRQECGPYAEKLDSGMIVNCVSEVTGQHSTGFVRKMTDGVMANCLTIGHNRRGAFVHFQKSTDHKNSNGYSAGKFYNCYWAASNSVENITPANMIDCAPVGDEELRSTAFIDQLNRNKGQYGSTWTLDPNGYPYFGKDYGENIIDGSNNRYPVQFVWHDQQVTTIEGGTLKLSPQMTDGNRMAGTFQLNGVPADSTILWSCDDRANQEIMQLQDDGRLFVFHDGGGVVRAIERKADGSEQLAAEIRVVSASSKIEELRLVLDGTVINGSATVQGSENKRLEVQARYIGSDSFQILPSYLVSVEAEKPELIATEYNTAAFYFKQPGTSNLTVKDKNGSASVTVSLTSAYVPVTSIRPAISGTEKIHYRNSMGSGEFISIPQTVFIEPENASYKDSFTVESSNTSIAEYGGNAYTPHKAGTVTFTAKVNDRGNELQGSSTVTFVYENPLAQVTAPKENIILAQNSSQILPLTFVGQPDNLHVVTEPDLLWSYSQEGIVRISRPNPLVQIRNTGGPDDGNWVASTEFEVKALRPGTVTVTGTPVDTSGNATPVTFTVQVTDDGAPVVGFDIPQFIADGKETAAAYLESHNTYSFGEEWTIYTLLRDGRTLPQEQLNQYYSDVVTNARSWTKNILPTEVERTALAVNILGKDITNVGGVNFVELICNHPNLTRQGSNALMGALMALDMRNTEIPAGMTWSRERIVAELLTYQNADGGFGLAKDGRSGVDMTAMILQVLARYQNQPEVAAAIQNGMSYLAKSVERSLNLGNAESIDQIIITFAVLGKDLTQEPGFGDEMDNLMSALAEYMVKGEGFKHDKKLKVDKMATIQSMQALCAYERFLNGQSGYWSLNADEISQLPDLIPDPKPDNKPDADSGSNSAKQPNRKPNHSSAPHSKPAVSDASQQSNDTATEGLSSDTQHFIISKSQLDAIKGQDKNLRQTYKLSSGEEYTVVINGMDIKDSQDMDVTLTLGGEHEADICKLAEHPFIFRLAHEGTLPAPMYLELPTSLEDGDYLLLQYNTAERKAELVEKVTITDGTLQCILSSGGEYFLAKHASSQSLNELEPTNAEAPQAAPENTDTNTSLILTIGAICVLLAVVLCGIAGYAIHKKRGGKKKEQ